MGKQALFYVLALFLSCSPPEKKQNETSQSTDYSFVVEQNLKWKALNAYVGKYSMDTDFFENELVKNELIKIMADDYKDYMKFVESAGYGMIEKVDNIIYCDISLEHAGGYNSLFFINTEEREMYLFWMNAAVHQKDYKIYGERPYPEAIKNIIENDMNTGWGHVAESVFVEDGLEINLLNPKSN
jgi:hypothetical protein